MTDLSSANFLRLRKNKLFWALLIAVVLFTLYMDHINYNEYILHPDFVNKPDATLLLFFPVRMAGIFFSAVVAIFIGADYNNGGLRNKLIIGIPRTRVYLSYYITAGLAGTIIWMGSFLTSFILMFTKYDIELTSNTILYVVISIIGVWFFAALLTLVSVLIANQAFGAVASIFISIIAYFLVISLLTTLSRPEIVVTDYVYDEEGQLMEILGPNPYYLAGGIRVLAKLLVCILPTGIDGALVENNACIENVFLAVVPLILIIIINTLGIAVFKRKDIK